MKYLVFLAFAGLNFGASADSKYFCEGACSYQQKVNGGCNTQHINIATEGNSPVLAFKDLRNQCNNYTNSLECGAYPATLSMLSPNGASSGKEDATVSNSCKPY